MRPQEVLRVLLSSGSGRMGVVLLAVLVTTSLYVLTTFPFDFGSRLWNNPAVWADNPPSVPPAWLNLIPGVDRTTHRVFEAREPSERTVSPGAVRQTYRFTSRLGDSQPPTFTSFSLGDVLYHGRPPVVTVVLTRPDGDQVVLAQHVVSGRRSGETGPVSRYTDAPFRLYISGDEDALYGAAEFLERRYGLSLPVTVLRGRLEQVLFGLPTGGAGLEGFQTLPGEYTIDVEVLLHDPADEIGMVKFVLGGAVFGAMGTDSQGRDLARGLLFGLPVALAIGITTALLVTIIGTFWGIVSGFSGGATDTTIQRSTDVLTNIPLLPILIFLIFILGQKLWLVVVILVVFGWPGLTITTRTMVLQLRGGQLVESTRALGASRWRIMFRHLLPQIAPFVLAQMIFLTPAAILAEAGLSFLGLGDPSIPTWGQILESGFRTGAVYLGYWWWVLPPGLLVVLTAMTFVLITLGLEPAVNPRLRATA